MLWPHLLLPLILALQPLPSSAQITAPREPGTGLPKQPPPLPEVPPRKYDFQANITGDWFGFRNKLSAAGIEITGGYAMEFLGNPIGGRSQGSTYVHNILLQSDFNLKKLIGLPNSAFRARFSQRSGDSLTNDHIGNTFNVQELYGGGQTYRLVELQMYHSLLEDRVNLAYGRLSATDDFLTSPLYCQFVNNAFCGQPDALLQPAGWNLLVPDSDMGCAGAIQSDTRHLRDGRRVRWRPRAGWAQRSRHGLQLR
jgi:hypothetical protein